MTTQEQGAYQQQAETVHQAQRRAERLEKIRSLVSRRRALEEKMNATTTKEKQTPHLRNARLSCAQNEDLANKYCNEKHLPWKTVQDRRAQVLNGAPPPSLADQGRLSSTDVITTFDRPE